MKNQEIVGIFGGSFSPPHIGHVRAAEAFVEAEKLDRLLVIPVFLPPHKSYEGVISPDHRLNMCLLAFGSIERAEINDCELKRGGKSYTSDTLEYFAKPGRRLVFLCGTDMFLTLESWHEFEKIFALAKIAFIRRENTTSDDLICEYAERYRRLYSADISEVVIPATELSSTEIRDSAKIGELNVELLPSGVAEYIKEHGLYQ